MPKVLGISRNMAKPEIIKEIEHIYNQIDCQKVYYNREISDWTIRKKLVMEKLSKLKIYILSLK